MPFGNKTNKNEQKAKKKAEDKNKHPSDFFGNEFDELWFQNQIIEDTDSHYER